MNQSPALTPTLSAAGLAATLNAQMDREGVPTDATAAATLPGQDATPGEQNNTANQKNGLRPAVDFAADWPSIGVIARQPIDHGLTLLANRFLCTYGGLLFVGGSGIGKSSASVQMDTLWSLGLPAFDVRPSRPLRILCVQAENDAGDLNEMANGVMNGLELTENERKTVEDRVYYATENERTGNEFLAWLDKRLEATMPRYRFDVLRIDPLLAYLGGDVSDPVVTKDFLRVGLNRILNKYKLGVIVNQHTPKTNNRDTSNYRSSDWMYAGVGSADITNWARAIIHVEATHDDHCFKFIAAKRGRRIGWVDDTSAPVTTRHFCHAEKGLCWRAAEAEDIERVESAAQAKAKTKFGGGGRAAPKQPEDVLHLIRPNEPVLKTRLVEVLGPQAGIGENKMRKYVDILLDERKIFKHQQPRAGTNAAVYLSREPNTLLSQQ